jgi:hypothetical protein
MRRGIVTTAILTAACIVPQAGKAASADYRDSNPWVQSVPQAKIILLGANGRRFKGPATGMRWMNLRSVKCQGDASGDYPVNRGRGAYHHMWCAGWLYPSVVVLFEYWPTGQRPSDYRVSDIQIFRP